jgi:nitrate reductase gamma subunit
MYCLVGFGLLLILGAILTLAGQDVSAESSGLFGLVVHYLTVVFGVAGWVFSIAGGIGLFFSRLFDTRLRRSAVLSDYTNLIMLLAVCVSGLVAWTTADSGYTVLRAYTTSLISFDTAAALPTAVSVQLWLWALLMFYFPFTHMTHMFGKYFTYHRIRWEDAPNTRGGPLEKSVSEALGYQINWSAPHIQTGSTWAEAATREEADNE